MNGYRVIWFRLLNAVFIHCYWTGTSGGGELREQSVMI